MESNRNDFYSYEVNQKGPLGKKIQVLIMRAKDYIVYIDEDGEIQYSCFDGKHDSKALGEVQNLVSLWETIINRIFNPKEALAYKGLLAEAYARVFDGSDLSEARLIVDRTALQVNKNGGEILKQRYIIACFEMTLLIICLGAILAFLHYRLPCLVKEGFYQMMIVTLCGGIGAFVFATLRLKNYTPDIHVSKNIHQLDGRMRVFYGIIAAFVLWLGIKSNTVLGFIDEGNTGLAVQALLGVMAGASEVIIPNLIRQVESKTPGV